MVEDREFEGTSEEEYFRGLDKYLKAQVWRPENWEETKLKIRDEYWEERNFDHIVKAVANAILEALIHEDTAEIWADNKGSYCIVSFPVQGLKVE